VLSSVANSLRVLVTLVNQGEMGVSDIGRELDLTGGTVFRLLSTLCEAGFAEQNPGNRKYRPGPQVLELANTIRSRTSFIDVAHAELETLMNQSGETVNLGVMRGDNVVYVDRVVGTQHQLVMEVRVGSTIPAFCSAMGKSLLAYADPESQRDYLERLPKIVTAEGINPPPGETFAKELGLVVASGHSEDHGEYSPDIACVAAPVLDSLGRATAAVSISGPRHRIETRRADLIPLVREGGKRLSEMAQRLGAAYARI
jgi:IclR family transcriptional regulator, KDG regulon repressor